MNAVRGSTGVANVVLASALSALVVMLGAYFAFARNTVTRDEMQTYVQTQSPFARAQGQFIHVQQDLERVQVDLLQLQIHNQHQDDLIEVIQADIRALERGERRHG